MTTLTVLDVGHGSCAIISDSASTVVVDAADRTHLLYYLEEKLIQELDLVIISHTDMDHVGGLINVLSSGIRVKRLVINPDSQKKSKTWSDIRALVDERVASGDIDLIMSVRAGGKYDWTELIDNVRLEIVSPSVQMALGGPGLRLPDGVHQVTSNTASIVVRVFFDAQPIALITGDMDAIALAEIKRRRTDISAKFLVFPHHGGLPGFGDAGEFARELVEMVTPESVVFSNGRGLHGTPKAEIINAINKHMPTPQISCTQLSANCCAMPMARIDYRPPVYSAGADNDSFCAGTVEIDLSAGEMNSVSLNAHLTFLEGLPMRLCNKQPQLIGRYQLHPKA